MLALLAQAGGNNQNNDDFDIPPEMMGVFVAFVCGFLIVLLIVAIFFLLTLSKALSRCHPRNRTMEPGQVWLNLIPLFNIVWQFITVYRVADSLRNEFSDRGWHRRDEDYGRGLGTAYCVLNLVSAIPYLGALFGLAGLICFIIYWVKIANYSSQLAAPGDYDDDNRDDDRDRDARDDRDRRDKPRGEHDDGYEDRPWERR
jgi:hypothetical protein